MNDTNITIVAAVASNGVIGKNNSLIWSYPNDLKRFRELTMGKMIVMGRKTHESIGKSLSGRHNIVMSRCSDYKPYDGAITLDLYEVLELSKNAEVMVIGGEQLYNIFLTHANKMHITNINCPYDGDAYFPEFDELDWSCVSTIENSGDAKHRTAYSFDTLIRKIRKSHD